MAQRGFGRPGRPRSARQRPRRCRPASRRPTSGAQLAQARPVSRARKGPGRSLSRWHSRTPGQGSGCRRFRLSADRHGGAGRGQPSGTLGRRPVFLEIISPANPSGRICAAGWDRPQDSLGRAMVRFQRSPRAIRPSPPCARSCRTLWRRHSPIGQDANGHGPAPALSGGRVDPRARPVRANRRQRPRGAPGPGSVGERAALMDLFTFCSTFCESCVHSDG
jgi:hypothetical protein